MERWIYTPGTQLRDYTRFSFSTQSQIWPRETKRRYSTNASNFCAGNDKYTQRDGSYILKILATKLDIDGYGF
ncbi:hypothetical protein EYC84_003354 [Monilinia fructicola]|uniref:Uncharacterized protein n=1 Tax=Monilinia fructicola TaxID=38448 RepID=A0A5M9JXA4_MONFR|nr:hypothetical protein EYC84_003354 [Monilinia fructicola]